MAVSGRGSNLLALGDALASAGQPARVVMVLSDRDAAALDSARSRGWDTHRLADFTDASEWLEVLDGSGADLLVLAGYLRLVPAGVVAALRGRIINIHPALLPDFGGRGMHGSRVHDAVLESGRPASGATVHLVDEEFDRGAILGQASVPVLPGDTAESLAGRVLEVEHRLLPAAVLAAAAAGRPVPFSIAGGDAAAE